jgi:hypothetical protein
MGAEIMVPEHEGRGGASLPSQPGDRLLARFDRQSQATKRVDLHEALQPSCPPTGIGEGFQGNFPIRRDRLALGVDALFERPGPGQHRDHIGRRPCGNGPVVGEAQSRPRRCQQVGRHIRPDEVGAKAFHGQHDYVEPVRPPGSHPDEIASPSDQKECCCEANEKPAA